MAKRTKIKYRHEFRWAVILTAFSAIWLLLANVTGLHDQRVDLYLSLEGLWMGPAALIFFLSIKSLRDNENEGELSFWQGVQSGTLVAVIAVPMDIALNLLYFLTIGAGFFDAAITYSLELGMDLGELDLFYSLPALLFRETTGIIAFGFIISLLVSMFLKSKVDSGPEEA